MAINRMDRTVAEIQVSTLLLDHAPVNVLDLEHCRSLTAILEVIRKEDRSRIVVLRGNGKHFSTGVDIKQHTREKMPELLPAFHEVFRALSQVRAVTVAAVHGCCLGGAAELALACDRVIAEETSRIGFPEINVGCYPPVAIPLVFARVGPGRATRMILSGAEIPAKELEGWGLLDTVFAPGEIEAVLDLEIARYSGKSPSVLGMAAELLHAEGWRLWGTRIPDLERRYLEELLPHPDATEGIEAFLGRRKPVWTRAEG